MLRSGWFRFILKSLILRVTFPVSVEPFLGLLLWSVLLSLSCSTTFFLALWQGFSICPAFYLLSLSLSICGLLVEQNPLYGKFFLLVNYHLVWSSSRDSMICLCLKVSFNFKSFIFRNWFWFVHISFVSMIRVHLHSSRWIVFPLLVLFFSCYFAVFSHMIALSLSPLSQHLLFL